MKFNHYALIHRVTLLLALCCALAASSVAQNQYFVSTTGSDSNDGSQARPWKTINHADAVLTVGSPGQCTATSGWISAAGIGACVHVAAGTYSGNINTNKDGSSGRESDMFLTLNMGPGLSVAVVAAR